MTHHSHHIQIPTFEGPVVYEDEGKLLWVGGTMAMTINDVFVVFAQYNPRRVSMQSGYLHLELESRADVDSAMIVHNSFYFGTKKLDVHRYNGSIRGRFHRSRDYDRYRRSPINNHYSHHHHQRYHHRDEDHHHHHQYHYREGSRKRSRTTTPPPEEEEEEDDEEEEETRNGTESERTSESESDGEESPPPTPRKLLKGDNNDENIDELVKEAEALLDTPNIPKDSLTRITKDLEFIIGDTKRAYWRAKNLVDLIAAFKEK